VDSYQVANGIEQKSDAVILLHGLGRTSWSMTHMEWYLLKNGFKVYNLNYPATKHTIEYLSDHYLSKQIKACQSETKEIHFVTHSFGGIILRHYLKSHKIKNMGRVVMLSPPNKGSFVAQKLKHNWLFRFLTGPSGQQLGTDKNSLPSQLGVVNFELGVITGTISLNPILSYIIPGRDDGKVGVDQTRICGMQDFMTVSLNHTFIMQDPKVISEAIHFLKTGKFKSSGYTMRLAFSNKPSIH